MGQKGAKAAGKPSQNLEATPSGKLKEKPSGKLSNKNLEATPSGKLKEKPSGKLSNKNLEATPSGKLKEKTSGKLSNKNLEVTPSGKTSGKLLNKNLEGKPSGKTSGKLSNKNLEGKPSGKKSGKLKGTSSGKLAPGAVPEVVLTRGVKWFWIIITVMMLASLAAAIATFILYLKARAVRTPYGEALEALRRHLAISHGRPDIEYRDSLYTASVVENLPNTIEAEHEELEAKKKKYRALLYKAVRSSSGPWKLHGTNLYYFSKGEKTWYDAETFCISRDAHLASVLNDEEQNFIHSQLQNNSWIGLTLKNEEGVWGWSDGSGLVTQYWSDGKPGNAEVFGESSQECVMMALSLSARNWSDESCHKLYGWVCKENLGYDRP